MRNSTFLKSFLLLCALIVGSSSVWAETYITTFSRSDSKLNCSGEITYTTSLNPSGNGDARGPQWGTSGTPAGEFTLTASTSISNITKVVVACCTASKGSATVEVKVGGTALGTKKTISPNAASTDDYTFEGSTLSGIVTVDVNASNKAFFLKSVTIYTTDSGGGSTVSTPTFNYGTGTYTSAQSVELTCLTDGATIHYTITENGTTPNDPTEDDATYSSAISVTKSGTIIKAKAFKSDMTASSVASATYTIKPNKPTVTVAVTAVTITGDAGCTFYYTTNGDAPDNTKTEYTAPFSLDADCTIKAKAYDAYGNASDVTSLKYKYMPLAPKNINSDYFVKVTDASDLENGDAILIVYEAGNVAMSTTQNNNNRGQADVTISDSKIKSISTDVQKLVLVKKTETVNEVDTEVFYFYTGSGYLYAPSSSSNHLKTWDAVPADNNNSRATISISSDDDAIITFKGVATRNLLRYNDSDGLFSCYASGQKSVQIYKEVPVTATVTAAGWATWVAPVNVTVPSGVEAYAVSLSGTHTELNALEAIPAGTPVLLKNEGTFEFPVATETPAAVTTALKVSEGVAVTNAFVLAKKNDVVGFYRWIGSDPIPEGKVYLIYTDSPAPDFIGFGDATGIETLNVENGTLNGEVYNLAGQRVAQPVKGLYIVNGKKVIIK